MIYLFVIGLSILALYLYTKFFKIPKLRNLIFIDGTTGAGKSFYSVALAVRLYKRAYRRYKISVFIGNVAHFLHFCKLAKLRFTEEPYLYSNIPLADVKHCRLTKDLFLRKVRFPYKSVVLIDDISMVMDQFDYKDRDLSDMMRDFTKLFRHETRGGYMIVNSQSTADLHYSLKAVLSDYTYIHHRLKFPFFSVLKCQEMAYSNDKDAGNIVNSVNQDIEEHLKMVFVLNRNYNRYDTYCYSIETDHLEVYKKAILLGKHDNLKTNLELTFRERGKTR